MTARVADGPTTASQRFIKNASWVISYVPEWKKAFMFVQVNDMRKNEGLNREKIMLRKNK